MVHTINSINLFDVTIINFYYIVNILQTFNSKMFLFIYMFKCFNWTFLKYLKIYKFDLTIFLQTLSFIQMCLIFFILCHGDNKQFNSRLFDKLV